MNDRAAVEKLKRVGKVDLSLSQSFLTLVLPPFKIHAQYPIICIHNLQLQAGLGGSAGP